MTITPARRTPADAAPERPLWPLALGGFGLIFAAAGLLWLKFGAAIFIDSLTAVWNCI